MSRKILCLLLSVASLGMFSSCKDEGGNGGGPTDLSQQIVGVYKGDMRVEVPLLSYDRTSLQKIYLTSSGENLAKLELRDFSFGLPGEEIPVGDIVVEDIDLKATGDAENATITLEPKTVTVTLSPEIGSAQVAINGTVVAGKLSLTINVSEALAVDRVNVTFSGDKMASDNESTEALMTTMTFDDEIVVGQPVIDGTNVLFHVADTAKAEHLTALVPTIGISAGATVSPASGTEVDFSNGSVRFTVTAEDGIHYTIYTVGWQRKGKYDFEQWTETGAGNAQRLDPDGWASCNAAVALIRQLVPTLYSGDFPVVPVAGHSGEYAAQITTLDTKGQGSMIPKVTSGTVFLGKFNAGKGMSAPMETTEFGILYDQKPLSVTGYYKYKAGPEYYDNKEPMPDGKDSMAISAVLYEVESETETLYGDNIYTSDKVVASAMLSSGEEVAEFTPFELKLKYVKTYNPEAMYKFAVIFSSSKYGALYQGAPGSVLTIDDVEVISE